MRRKIIYAICFLFCNLVLVNVKAQTINIHNYEDGFFDPQILDEFTQETGINIAIKTSNSIRDISSYLRNGTADVSIVPHTMLAELISAQLILPLNRDLLPNSTNLQNSINSKLVAVDKDNQYAIPITYSATKIAVNAHQVEQILQTTKLPNSWSLVFEPELVKKLAKCGIGVMDEPIDVMATLLNYQGVSVATVSKNQISRAGNLLADIAPYIKTVGADYRDDFNQGKLCIAITRTPTLGNQITPEEGIFVTIDTIVIGANSDKAEQIHKFINFILRPDIAARNLIYTKFPIPNTKIKSLVAPEIANNPDLFPSNTDIAVMQLLPKFSANITTQKVNLEFNKIKGISE